MSGPFKPEDFYPAVVFPADITFYEYVADQANAVDARRWACPEGGEHEPYGNENGDIETEGDSISRCYKCDKKIRGKWEPA